MPNDTKLNVRDTIVPSPYGDASSYFALESWEKENKRREQEQRFLASLARVQVNEHINPEENRNQGPEEGYEDTAKSHPLLAQDQRYDGAPDTDSQVPSQNMDPKTKREFENASRDKQLRKELKLGLQPGQRPKFNPTPTL